MVKATAGSRYRAEDEPVVVSLDCGTSKIRAALVSLEGNVLRVAEAPLDPSAGVLGDEPDVNTLWCLACGVLKEVSAGTPDIQGVGIACQLVQVFLSGDNAILHAFGWHDTRAGREALALGEEIGPAASARLGRILSAETAAARARWLAEHDGRSLERCASVLWLKDLFVYRLTGRIATDETHASYTGLFDVHCGTWDEQVVRAAGLRQEQLPSVLVGTDIVGVVSAEATKLCGIPAGVPVAAGGPDGTLGTLGAGALGAGSVADVAGTTDVLFSLWADAPPVVVPRAVANRFCLPGLFALGGPTGLTGGAVRWLAELLGYDNVGALYAAVGGQAAAADVRSDDPIFLPCLSGSRFPTWDADETGAIVNLRPRHTAASLLRAAEEGAAFVVREGLEVLAMQGAPPEEVLVVGGTSTEEWVLRLRATVFGVPILSTHGPEATMRGAAALAAVAAGACERVDQIVGTGITHSKRIEPDLRLRSRYDDMYARWVERRKNTAGSR